MLVLRIILAARGDNVFLFQVNKHKTYEWKDYKNLDSTKLNKLLGKPPDFIADIDTRLENICKVYNKQAEPGTLTQDEHSILKWIEGKKIQLTGLSLHKYSSEIGAKGGGGPARILIQISSDDTANGYLLPARYDEKNKAIIFVKPSEKPGKPSPGF